MERVETLAEIVQREVEDYHGPALKATSYYFENRKNQEYVVVMVPDYEYPRKYRADVVVMARVVGNAVIIDEDTTDRPLYKELMRAGIPREQIVLAYAGETTPEKSSQENQ